MQNSELLVSIHALVRVRRGEFELEGYEDSFNPRTRESATGMRVFDMMTREVSIHALVRVRLD